MTLPSGRASARPAPRYECWGRLWPEANNIETFEAGERLEPGDSGHPVLPFGNGRSYGDVCLNRSGSLLSSHRLNRILSFDPHTGDLEAEAGVLLSEILRFALPQGWFLPVTPGTQFVTLGGAIANDVHGKNHHVAGTFGRHLLAFELLRSSGECIEATPSQNEDFFRATIGGLGLTGFITRCRIRLVPVPGPTLRVRSERFGSLDEFSDLSRELDRTHEYSVSWVDCLAGQAQTGRGWYMAGNHAARAEQRPSPTSRLRITVPFAPPISPVNRWSLRAFNSLYYHRPVPREQLQDFRPFFYPLDAVKNWNRLYGRAGFFQFQAAVPGDGAPEVIREMLDAIRSSGQGSLLAVLKRFGSLTSPGLMSFPREGLTLALDFPNRGAPTRSLLRRLESMAMAAGGALYPAKDAVMLPETFRSSFPAWEQVEQMRDPAVNSDFWRRVTER